VPSRIDISRFGDLYRQSVRDVTRHLTPDGQRVVGRHSPALAPGRTDLRAYLDASVKRYEIALEAYRDAGGLTSGTPRALDAGGFLAAFPLALSRLGFDATLSETFSYYGGAFDELRAYVEANGVTVWDLDLTQPDAAPDASFQLVTNMAMIEHLPDSPRPLMDNLGALMAQDGRLIVEVPNIAYLPRRLQALRGNSVHPPLADLLESEPPYLGHHREYTAAELRQLLEATGFRVERLVHFNYSWDIQGPPWVRLRSKLLYEWPMRRVPALREVLLACAVPAAPASAPALPH
jgi:hypothetical protein